MSNIPLLRDILPGPEPRPPMSISLLARELNVPESRLLPLIENGYLRRVDEQTVETPLPAALLWLRSWFQPVQAKPLFSTADIASLLEIEEKTVPRLLAAHDIPATHDPAFGLVVSLWGIRRLLAEVLSDGTRFDRQALLWFLTGGPAKACPDFNAQLESEIERIASLPEPARSIRRENLLSQWRDAKLFAGHEGPAEIEEAFRKLA